MPPRIQIYTVPERRTGGEGERKGKVRLEAQVLEKTSSTSVLRVNSELSMRIPAQ